MSLLEKLNLALRTSLGVTLADLFWYALLAGAAWLAFYVLFPRVFRRRRLAAADPSRQQVVREIFHSLRSLAIFGLVAAVIVVAAIEGWTRIYVDDPRYGWKWFVASIALMILIHDAYFYWTHRLMHHPRLFRRMHHTHHLSTSPTPWAAYAFSPAEAFVQAGIAPLVLFAIPIHPAAFGLFMVWQIAFNVLGHCGHELFPRWFLKSPARVVLNTTTHHDLHHEKFRANFGLYFNWWDRLMGTNHPEYEARFDRAHGDSASIASGVKVALLAGLLAASPAAPVWAWGGQGHRHITQGAIPHLPLPLRGFFAANQSEVVSRAGDEPSGRHYIDIDYYPEFHAGTFPRNLNQLIAIHGFSVVDGNGRGPWTYNDLLNSLSAGMAAAQTPQQWIALLPTAAAMAHYIEDLHNPLHLTLNYDGQLTDNDGIHSRYESSMISRRINELTFAPATAVYLPSPIDFVFDGIDDHYPYVADIIAADDAAPSGSTAYYNSLWADTGDFTKQLFQEASVAVASSWYTAWINAGSPRTFLANASDFEADGDVDSRDLVVWTNSFGIDAIADANSNGFTDGHDFLLWQRQVRPTAIAAGVPEPSATALAIAVLAAMASPLRRRLERRVERPRFVL